VRVDGVALVDTTLTLPVAKTPPSTQPRARRAGVCIAIGLVALLLRRRRAPSAADGDRLSGAGTPGR
jgi:hypothetical protein